MVQTKPQRKCIQTHGLRQSRMTQNEESQIYQLKRMAMKQRIENDISYTPNNITYENYYDYENSQTDSKIADQNTNESYINSCDESSSVSSDQSNSFSKALTDIDIEKSQQLINVLTLDKLKDPATINMVVQVQYSVNDVILFDGQEQKMTPLFVFMIEQQTIRSIQIEKEIYLFNKQNFKCEKVYLPLQNQNLTQQYYIKEISGQNNRISVFDKIQKKLLACFTSQQLFDANMHIQQTNVEQSQIQQDKTKYFLKIIINEQITERLNKIEQRIIYCKLHTDTQEYLFKIVKQKPNLLIFTDIDGTLTQKDACLCCTYKPLVSTIKYIQLIHLSENIPIAVTARNFKYKKPTENYIKQVAKQLKSQSFPIFFISRQTMFPDWSIVVWFKHYFCQTIIDIAKELSKDNLKVYCFGNTLSDYAAFSMIVNCEPIIQIRK